MIFHSKFTPNEIEEYEERAAIMEHCGNMSRPDAESKARLCVGSRSMCPNVRFEAEIQRLKSEESRLVDD